MTASAIGAEEKAGDAAEDEHRHERDADAKQRDRRRHHDLPRAVQDGAFDVLPCSRCQLMFSIVTVASSTRMPTASARPPRVIMLMVSPIADNVAIEARIASGIEIVMISVERQLPRKTRIIRPVSAAAIDAFEHDRIYRGIHEDRLIVDRHRAEDVGQRLA